jgi:hypothetical protein
MGWHDKGWHDDGMARLILTVLKVNTQTNKQRRLFLARTAAVGRQRRCAKMELLQMLAFYLGIPFAVERPIIP